MERNNPQRRVWLSWIHRSRKTNRHLAMRHRILRGWGDTTPVSLNLTTLYTKKSKSYNMVNPSSPPKKTSPAGVSDNSRLDSNKLSPCWRRMNNWFTGCCDCLCWIDFEASIETRPWAAVHTGTKPRGPRPGVPPRNTHQGAGRCPSPWALKGCREAQTEMSSLLIPAPEAFLLPETRGAGAGARALARPGLWWEAQRPDNGEPPQLQGLGKSC